MTVLSQHFNYSANTPDGATHSLNKELNSFLKLGTVKPITFSMSVVKDEDEFVATGILIYEEVHT